MEHQFGPRKKTELTSTEAVGQSSEYHYDSLTSSLAYTASSCRRGSSVAMAAQDPGGGAAAAARRGSRRPRGVMALSDTGPLKAAMNR